MKELKILLVVFLIAFLTVPCFAEVPRLIKYEGELTMKSGAPYPPGDYEVFFSLYTCKDSDCSEYEILWEDMFEVTLSPRSVNLKDVSTIYEGDFWVVLGSQRPFPDDVFFDNPYWLHVEELKLGFTDDIQLTSAPYSLSSNYAIVAKDADTVDGIHASDKPVANKLLALDASGHFPSKVIMPGEVDADTVDGIHASYKPEANKLLALDASGYFPSKVIMPGEVDAGTVDGIDASYKPEANKLLALDSDSQFPNKVIKMGEGNGLDADTIDGKHADEFIGTDATSQTISGSLSITERVGIGTEKPSEKLEVAGNIKVSGEKNAVIFSDGSSQYTAAKEIPTGSSILRDSEKEIPGYQYTGFRVKAENRDVWTVKKDMLTAREAHGAVAVNGKVYVFGGRDQLKTDLDSVEIYDPATDTWDFGDNPMPTARHSSAVVAEGARVYVIGGFAYNEVYKMDVSLDVNEEYDTSTDTWTAKKTMITPRGRVASAEVNGKVYVIGGESTTISDNSEMVRKIESVNEVYDTINDSWTTKKAMRIAKTGHAAAAVNGKVYVIGGVPSSDRTVSERSESISKIAEREIPTIDKVILSSCEEYDPGQDVWSDMSDMPFARTYHTAVAAEGKVIVIGGYDGTDVVKKTLKFDPIWDKWDDEMDIPTARIFAGAVYDDVGKKVYVVGGMDGYKNILSANEELDALTGGINYFYVHKKIRSSSDDTKY